MNKLSLLFLSSIIFLFSCTNTSTVSSTNKDIIVDPHTSANASEVAVTHLDLDATVLFDKKQISGKATWTIKNKTKIDHIVFDTRDLTIQKITLGEEETPARFSSIKKAPFLGEALTITIDTNTIKLHIYYTTSPGAGALQWLSPQQTAGKKKPFLFTQSEPVLARSWVPCQDGPGIRFTYTARVKVPADLMAVMSAENSKAKNDSGIYLFKQTHSIPSYLLALAVGDLSFKPIDERTGVYAEPSVVDKAAYEFADMGKMVTAAENLYGPYRWGRYDVLVLPPSFPYGGMENPNLTFATPTVLVGDRSLVSLVAHELAHSWSGNLVTNASWNDVWLNEGFTTYFERRIVEEVYGKEEAAMQEVLGYGALQDIINELGANSADTRLKTDYTNRDPDGAINDIPYEKGHAFLRTIEQTVGRKQFDPFLKNYFDHFAFQSITTETFLNYLEEQLGKSNPQLLEKIHANEWVHQPGIPKSFVIPSSKRFAQIDSLLKLWTSTKYTKGLHAQIKSTNEQLYFINHLPDTLTQPDLLALDEEFHFTQSSNAEIQTAWYPIAIHNQYQQAYPYIEQFLLHVGRRRYLRPIYKEMIKTGEGKAWAKRVYAKARPNYHPVSYTTIDELLK